MAKPTVVVTGVTEIRRDLGKFAPDIRKEVDNYLKKELGGELIRNAQSLVPEMPLRGWAHNGRTGWNAAKTKSQIKIKQGSRAKGMSFSALLQLRDDSAPGSIFMAAGRRNQPENPQGPAFIKALNSKFGTLTYKRGTRVLWPAFLKYGPTKYQDKVLEAYAKAEKDLQQRMDSVKNVGIR